MSAAAPSPPVIVAIYSEIALKGKNRHLFTRRLINNLRRALRDEPLAAIDHVESRLLVRLDEPGRIPATIEKMRLVFGIQTISVATPVPRSAPGDDLEKVCAVAADLAADDVGGARHFKVETQRSDKTFPLVSPEISARVGGAVQSRLGLPARMSRPDFKVHVLVLKQNILVYTRKIPGPAGLPAQSSGRVAVLLSGGIDSPVAAWMMMRRGCRPEFCHFFAGRTVSEAVPDKIVRLVSALARYSPVPLSLNLLPVVPYEERAIGVVEDSFDMVMFRRFLFKATAELARRRSCLALVAGDSLGQVASQTLPNLQAVAPDLEVPVLRPLIGLDKLQIIGLGVEIGTYDISIEPYRDCCSIRSPRPVLKATPAQVLRRSRALDLEAAITDSLAAAECWRIGPAGRCV